MSTTTFDPTTMYPPLSLGWREVNHGRSFRGSDRDVTYCTECLDDLPEDIVGQLMHTCPKPGERAPIVAEPPSTARPVKGLRRFGDLALSREPQAGGSVRYTVHRITDDGAVPTVLFIDRDRWERDDSQRYKAFLAGVWQDGGFMTGGSYCARQINFAPTLAGAVAGCRPSLAANPVGALDA